MKAFTKYEKHKNDLTPGQMRVIRHQVALECQTITRKWEVAQDICFVYTLVDSLGFGKKRCEEVYRKFWEARDEIQRYVRADGENNDLEDGLRESMMEKVLMSRGIDVRKWNEQYGKDRLEYRIVE